jgi:hypothetical protein
MSIPDTHHAQPLPGFLTGALAHLAQHMESGCQRSALLAAILLRQAATDPDADSDLREHAGRLIDILERKTGPAPMHSNGTTVHAAPDRARSNTGKCL